MTSQHDKAKRWRPRFSARTLVIVVTLVCCYAACWGPTKVRGVGQVVHRACREIGMDFPEDTPSPCSCSTLMLMRLQQYRWLSASPCPAPVTVISTSGSSATSPSCLYRGSCQTMRTSRTTLRPQPASHNHSRLLTLPPLPDTFSI